jgi:Cu-Zn family superoxide dismutase
VRARRGRDGNRRAHGKKPGKGQAQERVFTLQPDPAGNPEGIAYQKRSRSFFVGITLGGAIYRGTLDSDTVSPFIPGTTGASAVGMKVRGNRLYVAGGMTGTITVYDLSTKQAIATFQTGATGFLNDLVVTRNGGVWVTDSFRPTLWHVTGKAGAGRWRNAAGDRPVGGLRPHTECVPRQRDRRAQQPPVRGRRHDDRDALSHQRRPQRRGSDPGDHRRQSARGDGMIQDRGRLVVVQGGPPAQLSFVKLNHSARGGTVVGTKTSTNLRGPSTVARARRLYLVVNADFNTNTKPFTVDGLPR